MKRLHRSKTIVGDYIHSSFFGIEDSLVSTTGVVAGIAISTSNKSFIIISGIIVIAVEAISMGASEFISEETEEEIEIQSAEAKPAVSGLIMFISYILAGIVPILPFVFLPIPTAIVWSVVAALVGLIILGIFKGELTHKSILRSSLEVLIIGGISAAIGIAVGIIFKL